MAYQVLARKYRPQRFSDVVGQDHVTRTLLNALAQNRIAHGYIFSGHRGIGKTTIARILAMALNCRTAIGDPGRPSAEPCEVCVSCTEVRAGNAVDVIEIDAATNRGIDEIRELRDAARYRPARDRYKVYILDEAHQITDAAFNALLKTLEEPPDHVVFMMATTQAEDIPQTIRSRCQHFSFHAVKFDDILVQLRAIAGEEQIGAEDEALALLAEAGDGSMRDALSIMDQAIASAPLAGTGPEARPQLDPAQIRELMGAVPNSVFERLMEAIGENQSAPVIEEINRLINAGNSASQLARQFVRYLRNVLMARIAGERSELLQLSPDERARAGRSALLFSEEDLTRFLGVMLRTFDELNYRQEPRFHLELGLLKLVHLQRLLPIEQLLSQMGGAVPKSAGGVPKLGGGPLPSTRAERVSGETGSGPAALRGEHGLAGRGASSSSTGGGSAGMARSSAAGVGGAAEAAPAFSPFEADSRRKESGRGSLDRPVAAEPGVAAGTLTRSTPQGQAAMAELEPDLPEPAASPKPASAASPEPAPATSPKPAPATSPKPASAALPELAAAPSAEAPAFATLDGQGAGAAADAVQRSAAAAEVTGASLDTSGESSTEIDLICQKVCAALDQAGHNTAAALLGSAEWMDAGERIVVKVAAKKTMLGLTMNTEAERICREVMRSLASDGKPRVLSFEPGEAGSTGAPVRRTMGAGGGANGTVQSLAMENPLVKQAQELFGAEVRSVVDLRNQDARNK